MITVTTTIRDETLTPYLEKRAAVHQKALRELFVAIYIADEDANQAYNRVAAKHGIFAVEINSIRKETEAIYSSWKELLAVRIEEQVGKIKKLEAKLKNPSISSFKAHQWERQLHRYQCKLASMRAELESGIPHICFGGKGLFYKQFRLKENGYREHAAWKEDWEEARSSAFYLAGRAREHSGNDACLMEVLNASNEALICVLRLRKKNNEISGRKAKPGDYIPIQVKFTYNHKYILQALEENRPITYRFIRIDGTWNVQAIVDLPSVPIITDAKNGSIGVDQNPLCIAAASLKPDGNLEDIHVHKLTQGHRSADQAEYELSQVVCSLVEQAVITHRPIVIEKLEFPRIQRELKSRGLNRVLSRFKYSLFQKLLYGRAAKYGVEVIEVNPAFSSIIGWIKFGYGYGLSRHQAAAIAIGRRLTRPSGKRFSERIRARLTPGHPAARKLSRDASPEPARKRTEHGWTGWRRLGKLLAREPSKTKGAMSKKPLAASRHEAKKQEHSPYPLGQTKTPIEMDASETGPKDPSANRRGTVYAPA